MDQDRDPRAGLGWHGHLLGLYAHDLELEGWLGAWMADGVRAGEYVVVLTRSTRRRRERFAGPLRAHGVDPDSPEVRALVDVVSVDDFTAQEDPLAAVRATARDRGLPAARLAAEESSVLTVLTPEQIAAWERGVESDRRREAPVDTADAKDTTDTDSPGTSETPGTPGTRQGADQADQADPSREDPPASVLCLYPRARTVAATLDRLSRRHLDGTTTTQVQTRGTGARLEVAGIVDSFGQDVVGAALRAVGARLGAARTLDVDVGRVGFLSAVGARAIGDGTRDFRRRGGTVRVHARPARIHRVVARHLRDVPRISVADPVGALDGPVGRRAPRT